ncbi:uncharacterized protein LOC144435409 [Glandiceps talaboti]
MIQPYHRYLTLTLTFILLMDYCIHDPAHAIIMSMSSIEMIPLSGNHTASPLTMNTELQSIIICALCRPSNSLDGGNCYNPEKEMCCDGIIYDIQLIPNAKCCGDRAYNPIDESCCVDRNLHGRRAGRVQSYLYNPASEVCCIDTKGNVTIHYVETTDGKDFQCCDGVVYDTEDSLCCDKLVHKVTKSNQCCGRHAIDVKSHICCDGRVYRLRNGGTDCCGNRVFNPMIQRCCGGVLYPLKGQEINADPCSDAFRTDEHVLSCGNITFNSSYEICCAGYSYNADTHICCNHTVIEVSGVEGSNGLSSRCCGTESIQVYNPETQMCCFDRVHRRSEAGCSALLKAIKNWYVSQEGKDREGCGTTPVNACRSIDYAMAFLEWGDSLFIDGRGSEDEPYEITCTTDKYSNGMVGLLFNISVSIIGYNSQVYLVGSADNCKLLTFNGAGMTKLKEPMLVTLKSLTIAHTTAAMSEGVITVCNAALSVLSCIFMNNKNGYSLIFNLDDKIDDVEYRLLVNDSIFVNNSGAVMIGMPLTNEVGGCVDITLKDCRFQLNSPNGALVIQDIGTIDLFCHADNVTFKENQRASGGAVNIKSIGSDGYIGTTEVSLIGMEDRKCLYADDGYPPSNDIVSKNDLSNTSIVGAPVYRDFANFSSIILSFSFISVQFIANSAKGMGGGLYANLPQSTVLTFADVLFEDNLATDQTGRGGATFINGGYVRLLSSRIINNIAPFLAGSWYNDYSTYYFEIKDTVFRNKFSSVSTRTGELLFSDSQGPVVISNSTFEVDTTAFQDITVLFHEAEGNFTLDLSSSVSCSIGYNLTIVDTFYLGTHNVSFICKPCPAKTYSFEKAYSHGTENVQGVNCLPCPVMGNCDHTNVVPRPNNWGFRVDGTPVKVGFASCPSGRCCTSQDQDHCLHFDSCPHNRSGTLCSECRPGHVSVLGSTLCIEQENCPDYSEAIMITFLISFTTLFLIFLLFKVILSKKVFHGLSRFSLRQQPSGKCVPLENVVKNSPTQYEVDDSVKIEHMSKESKSRQPTTGLSWEKSDDYVKIIFFFYQAADLVIFDRSSDPSSYREGLENFVVKLFNFQVVPPFTVTCIRDTEDIWPLTSSTVFTNGRFFINLWILLIFPYFASRATDKASQLCCKRSFKVSVITFHCSTYLARASVQLYLLGYVVIARGAFIRLDCTQINNHTNLTYFGSVSCDQWWSHGVLLYAVTGVLPFCVVVLVGSYLLEKNVVGVTQFLCACIFPLPFVLISWPILVMRLVYKKRKHIKRPRFMEAETGGKDYSFIALEVLQGPFKTDKRRYWEVILIGSRLAMVLCHFGIADILFRSLLLVLVCAIIAVIHTVAQPFTSTTANRTKMMSLILLVLIAGLNALDVLSHSYVTSFAEPEGTLEWILEWVEFVFIMLPITVLFACVIFSLFLTCWSCKKNTKHGKVISSQNERERLLEDELQDTPESPHSAKKIRFHQSTTNDGSEKGPSLSPRKTSPSVLIDSGYQSESTAGPIHCQEDAGQANPTVCVLDTDDYPHNSVDFCDAPVLLENALHVEEACTGAANNIDVLVDVHDQSKRNHGKFCSEVNSPNDCFAVYNWRDDQAYIIACLDQFHDILGGLPDPSLLSSTNFTTNIFAAGEFNNEGGHLTIEQAGVNLFIPPGALSESDGPKRLFICVSPVDREYPRLNANQTALTPVIRCGPHGLKFQKHVLLSIKHCLEPSEVSEKLKLLASDADMSQPMKWYNASDTGKVLCICQGNDTISFSNVLSTFTVVCNVTSMKFRVGGFITHVSQRSSKLRIRLWRATAADTELVNVKESSLHGKKVGSDSECVLSKNGKGLHIKLNKLCKNWKLLDDSLKVISSELIWQQSHSTGPSVVITYLVESRNVDQRAAPLSANITVTDDTETSEITRFDLSE